MVASPHGNNPDMECIVLMDEKSGYQKLSSKKTSNRLQWKEIKREGKSLSKLAFPIYLSNLLQFLMITGTTIMTGRLSATEFDAAALSVSTTGTYGIYVLQGLVTACDTIFAQTIGSGQRKRTGMWLQKSFLIVNLFAIVVAAVHLNSELIFILLGQEAKLSKLAAEFSTVMSVGIVAYANYLILLRYLQNMDIIYPPVFMTLISAIFNISSQYIGIYILNIGYSCVPYCHTASFVLLFVQILLYVLVSKVYRDSWDGLKRESLAAWKEFSIIGISGLCSIASESITFHTAVLLSGTINSDLLGAQNVLYQIDAIGYMLPFAIGIAVNIRVGQALGNLNAEAAKRTLKVATGISVLMTTTMGILLISFRSIIPYIFTSHWSVIEAVSNVIPLVAVALIFDGVRASTDGAVRGCGRQGVGAIILLISYYAVGMSIAVPLMKMTPLHLTGFWIGIDIGIAVSVLLSLLFLLLFLDWNKEAVKARARVFAAERPPSANGKSSQPPPANEKTSLLPRDRPRRQYPREPRSCSTNFEILPFIVELSDAEFIRLCIKRGLMYFGGFAFIGINLVLRFTVFAQVVTDLTTRNESISFVPSHNGTSLQNLSFR